MKLLAFVVVSLVFIAACSTEKNTLLSRTYHGTTAHYNGYFNANELIKQSMTGYLDSRKEDYYSLLELNPVPDEEEVKGMYPSIDTAIAKSTEVIAKHSMPTASEPSKKRSEHNAWIDENWLTIGIANYYRRDYETAQKNFKYINKFFANDPSNYTAAIWMAKTHIQTRNFSDANLILMEIDKKIEEQEAAKESKSDSKSKKSKTKKKKKSKYSKKEEEEEKAEFPKKSRYLFETTKAELAILQDEKDKAIENLEKALEFAKKSAQKARIHYILAQLNAQKQQNDKAKYHYGKVLRYNAPFEMAFNARINRALMGGDAKIKKELEKMLRDEKNLEFKDQIYYALADIAFKEGNKEKGIENLHQSVIFSTSNNRQKALSYERLGDLSFAGRDYVKAQKYYDSCAKVLPDTYPNADGIRNKATKLKDLVVAVETAAYEDSVQRIAALSEEDRYKFASDVIRKMKEDEKRRKQEEAIRLKELQEQQSANENTASGNKFFWNSPKLKNEGLESFRKLWGSRENEDDWRRSDKIVVASFENPELDSAAANADQEVKDSITPESLLANLPINDSLLSASNERMLNAYYDAGIIYKDQLNETQMAIKQFQAILDRKIVSDFNLLALYQLYKIYEVPDPPLAYSYKNEILINYPDSDYANYLRDPDFFVKRKEQEKLAEEDYLKTMDRYKRGLYSLVISAADEVIDNQKTNSYRAKFMLLKALSIAQTNENKAEMMPVLKQVIAEYPGTMEEQKARELIEIHEKGYSAYAQANFENKSIYTYVDDAEQWIIIIPDKKVNLNTAKSRVVDFNREFYGKEKFTVVTKVLGTDQNVLLVKEMSEAKGRDYIRTYRKTKKLMEVQEAKIMMITSDNIKILFDAQNTTEYESFYTEFY